MSKNLGFVDFDDVAAAAAVVGVAGVTLMGFVLGVGGADVAVVVVEFGTKVIRLVWRRADIFLFEFLF
jgi:uncharacterized membrane protein